MLIKLLFPTVLCVYVVWEKRGDLLLMVTDVVQQDLHAVLNSPRPSQTHVHRPEASTLKSCSLAFITSNHLLQNTMNDASEDILH